MARLFTVPFLYREQTCTAVVSFTAPEGKHIVTIYVPDESLHPILGGSAFTFEADKGLPIDTPELTPAQELMVSILTSVEQYDQQWKAAFNVQQSS